jgi:hypothetical protein
MNPTTATQRFSASGYEKIKDASSPVIGAYFVGIQSDVLMVRGVGADPTPTLAHTKKSPAEGD